MKKYQIREEYDQEYGKTVYWAYDENGLVGGSLGNTAEECEKNLRSIVLRKTKVVKELEL